MKSASVWNMGDKMSKIMTGTRIGTSFLKLSLYIGLICAVTNPSDISEHSGNCSLDALDNHSFNVKSQHYNVELTQGLDSFAGQSDIIVEIIRETANITFHGCDLRIDQDTVKVLRHQRGNQYTIVRLEKLSWDAESQVFDLKFHEKLFPGNYTISLKFSGVPLKGQSFLATGEVNMQTDSTILYLTLFEQIGAQRVFPCWNESSFKTTFNISVEHSSAVQVFSNMPFNKNMPISKQRALTTFEPVVSIYPAAIAITEFTLNATEEENIVIWPDWSQKGQMCAVRRNVQTANNSLTNYTKYNLAINIFAHPNFSSIVEGAQELAFRDTGSSRESGNSVPDSKLEMSKMASQMTGQGVTNFTNLTDWSHQWLSHAFAKYFSYQIDEMNKKRNKDVMTQLFVVQVLQPAMHNDYARDVPPVLSEYDPTYAPLIYNKVAAMLRMLEFIVTKRHLHEALAEYLRTYEYGSATINEFLEILDKKIEESNYTKHRNVANIMRVWLSQRHYPTLLVQVTYDGMTTVESYETKYSNKNHSVWPIPVTVAKEIKPSFKSNSIMWMNTNLPGSERDVLEYNDFDKEEWIIFNVQQYGYYRVNYEYENWVKIVKCLNNGNHTAIHVLNRAQIIDDAYHFVMEREINYVIFSQLVDYLRYEKEFAPWYSMMNVLDYMSVFFNYPESENFKKLMLNIVNHALNKIFKYVEDPNDDDTLKNTRILLMNWACKHGNAKCRKNAQLSLIKHMKNPTKHKISPTRREWAYCAGLMNITITYRSKEKNEKAQRLIKNIIYEPKEKLLDYLVCVDDDYIIQELVALTTFSPQGKWTELESKVLRKLYRDLVKRHARKPQVFYFLLGNMKKIVEGRMSYMEGIIDIIMNVYSKCQLDTILEHVTEEKLLDAEKQNEIRRLVYLRESEIRKERDVFVHCFHESKFINNC